MWLSLTIFIVVVLATYKATAVLKSDYEIISMDFEGSRKNDDVTATSADGTKLNFA